MNDTPDQLRSPYNPSETEQRIYKTWEEQDLFSPEGARRAGVVDDSLPPFSMVLPPPNVTGVLHAGHALTVAIEDVVVRYARMNGRETVWLPGTDHAAIATQTKVEKEL